MRKEHSSTSSEWWRKAW